MNPQQFIFEAIGTRWVIDIIDRISKKEADALMTAVHDRIASFDAIYSRFRDDSLVTKMAEKAGTYTLPMDAQPLLLLYKKLYDLTHGAFTPFIGKTLEEAGYDAAYSLQSKTLHKPPAWDDVLSYDAESIHIKKPVVFDIGAAGKGYLVDLVGGIIASHGIQSYCVDAGGDILYKTDASKRLRVGLEHPENVKQVIGVASIHNQSICGSAGNRRKWGKFHHIINPHTLKSPTHIIATWVIADNALLADALATCLYFVEPDKLKAFSFHYAIMYPDHSLKLSPDFPAEIYYNE